MSGIERREIRKYVYFRSREVFSVDKRGGPRGPCPRNVRRRLQNQPSRPRQAHGIRRRIVYQQIVAREQREEPFEAEEPDDEGAIEPRGAYSEEQDDEATPD